ncbi:uncharacterized protein [Panulirus ornatus]
MELGLKELRVNSTHDIRNSSSKFSEIGGIKLDLALPIEQWVRVLEQVLLVMLLVGRWLLPKGQLTREQLSQLLLAYMAMAADIIELFECFKEDAVAMNIELIYATLGIWSWSLMQFTLVLSATHAPKLRPSINYPPPEEVIALENNNNNNNNNNKSNNNNNICASDGVASSATCGYSINQYLDMDIIAILTTVFMQDGPFFLLRMTLIFGYNVISYLNIFFTCKNTLVVSLQLYRLFVLCSKKRHLNMKKKEPLSEQRTPSVVSVGSEDSSHHEPSMMVQRHPSLVLPSAPPHTTAAALTPADKLDINQALEESLLEIIEQIGEENVLKELENLISLPDEEEMAKMNSSTSSREVNEQSVGQTSKGEPLTCPARECEECLEESRYTGSQNYSSPPSYHRKTLKRQHSVAKRNQEYVRRIQDFQNSCYGSDYYSDNDVANDRIHSVQGGIGLSSTSLTDPHTESRRHGWNVIHDRYLTQQEGEWRGTSVPSILHRESPKRGVHTSIAPLLPHHDSDSPQFCRREKHGSSLKGGNRSRVPLRSSLGSSLPCHQSFATRDHIPSKCDCISESDADTLETNV